MLVKVCDPDCWQPPDEFDTHAQLGSIVSGRGTAEALKALEKLYLILKRKGVI